MYCNERLPSFRSRSARLACCMFTEDITSGLEIIRLALCHQVAIYNLNQLGAVKISNSIAQRCARRELKRDTVVTHKRKRDLRMRNGLQTFDRRLASANGTLVILAFIVVVASFNIVTTLTLLVLEKKREISIMKAIDVCGTERKAESLFDLL